MELPFTPCPRFLPCPSPPPILIARLFFKARRAFSFFFWLESPGPFCFLFDVFFTRLSFRNSLFFPPLFPLLFFARISPCSLLPRRRSRDLSASSSARWPRLYLTPRPARFLQLARISCACDRIRRSWAAPGPPLSLSSPRPPCQPREGSPFDRALNHSENAPLRAGADFTFDRFLRNRRIQTKSHRLMSSCKALVVFLPFLFSRQ